MSNNAKFAEIASLAGDPARAGMLHALMDGRALTASELARAAGITPQTASGHLARLTTAGVLAVETQGRHRYHRLASAAVARMIESIMQVAAATPAPRPVFTGPRDVALRAGRTCYDHLAGSLGVALTDALVARRHVELDNEAGIVTTAGAQALAAIGVDIAALKPRGPGRLLCRPCLDWSERRPHLGGALGAALCARCFEQGWIKRIENTRAVSLTPKGRAGLHAALGVTL